MTSALLDAAGDDYPSAFAESLEANALVRALDPTEATHLGISASAAVAQMAAMRAVSGALRGGGSPLRVRLCLPQREPYLMVSILTSFKV